MKKHAFTLAEILITLGVIGVVAAMTLPTVIKNYKAITLRSQLNKAYSSFSQATQMIYNTEFGGTDDFKNMSSSDLIVLYQKYMRKAVKCNRLETCPAGVFPQNVNNNFSSFIVNNYKTYSGNQVMSGCISDVAMVLQDNTFTIIDSCGENPPVITIDINGWRKAPNGLGHDFFMFQIINGNLTPVGISGTSWDTCSKTSTSSLNGRGCTAKALSDKDYFKNLPK